MINLYKKIYILQIHNNTMISNSNEEENITIKYCNNCIIVKCSGDKCRIHHNDGIGYHCRSCYGVEHDDEPISENPVTKLQFVNCRGDKCRLSRHNTNGLIQCRACYGSDISDSEES